MNYKAFIKSIITKRFIIMVFTAINSVILLLLFKKNDNESFSYLPEKQLSSVSNDDSLVITSEDQAILNKIIISTEKKNWVFNDSEINKFKFGLVQLNNLYNLYEYKKDSREKALLELYLGALFYFVHEDYKQSEFFLLKAYKNKKFLKMNETFLLLTILGDDEKTQFNFVNSIYFYNTSLNLAKNCKNEFEEYRALREIGVNNRDLEDYSKAEKYFLAAKKLQDKIKITDEDEIWLDIHLGVLYQKMKKYNIAKSYLSRALNNKKLQKATRVKPYVLYQLADFWMELNNTYLAKKYALEGITLTEDHTENRFNSDNAEKFDKFILPPSYNILGKIYLSEHDTVSAIKNFEKAFSIGEKTNLLKDTRVSARYLYRIKKDADRTIYFNYIENSAKIHEEFMKDSQIFTQQLNQLRVKEKDLKIIERNNRYSQTIIISLISCIIIFIIISILTNKNLKKLNAQKIKLNKIFKTYMNTGKRINNFYSRYELYDIKIFNLLLNELNRLNKNIEQSGYEVDTEQYFNTIYNSISHTLSTIESSKNLNLKIQEIDIKKVLDNIKEPLNSNIGEFTINYPDNLPTFRGLEIHLILLFKNIIENSLNFGNPNKPTIINIYVYKKNKNLSIIVSDNGLGISKLKQKNILELFDYKKNSSPIKGIGTGIYILKKIIDDYNGNIKLSSSLGNGTRIHINMTEKESKAT